MLFVTENAGSRRNSSCKNVTGPMLLPPPRLLLPAFVRASGRALCSSSCGDEREKVLLSPGPAQLHSRMPQWSAVRWWGASSGESSFLQKMHSVNPPNRSAPASLELRDKFTSISDDLIFCSNYSQSVWYFILVGWGLTCVQADCLSWALSISLST